MQLVQNILPQDYASLQQANAPPALIDVREPYHGVSMQLCTHR
jgi:hypothetical protein